MTPDFAWDMFVGSVAVAVGIFTISGALWFTIVLAVDAKKHLNN